LFYKHAVIVLISISAAIIIGGFGFYNYNKRESHTVISTQQIGVDILEKTQCFHGSESHIPLVSLSSEVLNQSTCVVREKNGDFCGYRVVDGLFSSEDISLLHAIVNKGLSRRKQLGGPTILDINTGYIRDIAGLENLFTTNTNNNKGDETSSIMSDVFTPEDFSHYGRIIRVLKSVVAKTFHIRAEQDLFFTAPTFITRIDESLPWKVQGIHDEYWHTHVDMNNTAHYHYSGLLYLSTYNKDFTGGRFKLYSANKNNNLQDRPGSKRSKKHQSMEEEKDLKLVLEPAAGRVVMFTSGPEHPHRVERVTSGQRIVLSFWFSCDSKREFEIFLDGKAHTAFSRKIGQAIHAKRSQQRNG